MDVRLTQDQIRRIRLAKSSAEVAEIVAETEQEQAEHAAQTEAETPTAIRKPRYVSIDGFLHEV